MKNKGYEECDYCACFTECFEDNAMQMSCKDCAKTHGSSKFLNDFAKKELDKKRQLAKSQNLKALKGSFKQKKWGEDIRKNFIGEASSFANFIEVFNKSNTLSQAKFWIENRDTKNLVSKIFALVAYVKEINEGNKDADLFERYKNAEKELKIT